VSVFSQSTNGGHRGESWPVAPAALRVPLRGAATVRKVTARWHWPGAPHRVTTPGDPERMRQIIAGGWVARGAW